MSAGRGILANTKFTWARSCSKYYDDAKFSNIVLLSPEFTVYEVERDVHRSCNLGLSAEVP